MLACMGSSFPLYTLANVASPYAQLKEQCPDVISLRVYLQLNLLLNRNWGEGGQDPLIFEWAVEK
jgi:hypothetical protein